ncbi:cation-transporting ATPase [Spiroplasma clarkii]|nr:cation-transporting ATPase [Spiroplasma clarkii]
MSQKNENLEKELETNFEEGLTSEQVEDRLQKYGRNELPQGKVTPWYLIFLKTLTQPIQIILIIAAIISVIAPLISNHWEVHFEVFIDFMVIISIVLIDGILETVQEVKARKSMDALKEISKPKAVVIRNDGQQEIDAGELVVGDIVVLEAGKYIPAELKIIEASDLMIDESILTGESVPVEKIDTPLAKTTQILAEMKNIAFMSTVVTAGRAIGVVIKTGKDTEIGKIATSINENDESHTPLEKKFNRFTMIIALISFLIGIAIFLTLFVSGDQKAWANHLMVAITLAIGVIPECLAAIISITLSFSTKRMATENVIVKKLQAVETLGSVNVICTDKTGTLTQNKMTVQKIIINNQIIDGKKYSLEKKDEHADYFLKSLVLCNDSVTEGLERIGDPTELALVDFAESMGYDEQDARDEWKRIDEIPFDSERKMMTTVNNINGVNTTFTKGALDQLLKHCTKIMVNNTVRTITQADKDSLLEIANKLSDDALRVLAFAYNTSYDVEPDQDDLEHDLTFIAGVAMIDPVRESAVNAVKQAHDAGVKVVMITGDHAVTALAIAKELDIAHSMNEVMSSERLNSLSDDELYQIIEQINVFARVNPEHKVRIVDAFQRRGNITSMTGDGVNDAPSLTKADIGVAMGITGTDVAKQAADIILTDDNFETIIKGVNEGRNVYQKIKRAVTFVIGVNMANVISIFVLSALNSVSPVEATNILWMNLIVESLIAISMGMGANDNSLMKVKPIKGKNPLFRGIWWSMIKITMFTSIASIAAWYFGMGFVNTQVIESALSQAGYNEAQVSEILIRNNHGWYQIFKDHNVLISAKVIIGNFGRTAMFIAITCGPCGYANLIKLSQWQTSKKINIIVNKPLWICSMGALGLNIIVIFVPGLNTSILNLIPLTEYQTAWYLIPVSLAIAAAPTFIILALDGIVFVTYHYFPDPKRRNQMLVAEMIKSDKLLAEKKRKKAKAKKQKEEAEANK